MNDLGIIIIHLAIHKNRDQIKAFKHIIRFLRTPSPCVSMEGYITVILA